ncbi:hypothetical protein [Streptomyces sp. NPDC058583]|uniref:hypothetical protein n=1 Tax=unclassified Streptomyces TaxID=2593676 RepID=UPI00365CBDDF
MSGKPSSELRALIDYLLTAKGQRTYRALAHRCGNNPSSSTLCRTVDGRMPGEGVVAAFARAAGGDPVEVVRFQDAARKAQADRLASAAPVRGPYVPGPVSTLRGLARAMRRVKDDAGLSMRALDRQIRGVVPRSTLTLVLRGKSFPRPGSWTPS